jgi:hypothetical protein
MEVLAGPQQTAARLLLAIRIFSDRALCLPRVQVTKDFDSARHLDSGLLPARQRGVTEIPIMTDKTCAACDYKLDENAIKVKLGGKTVEVCCEECARKLKEAHGATP